MIRKSRKTTIGRNLGHALALAMALGAFQPAAAADALIEGAKLCTQQFPTHEQRNGIPTHLLAAISTTESGRWHDGLGMSVPWPWTINVDGKGYYFNSKAEAIAQTQRFQRAGHESIDVGCMQVNLKHHPKAFSDLNQSFDPSANVAYAAKFLHDNYADLGDWIKATAAYHSRTPVYGQKYLGNIERSWNKIVAKVAAARAQKGNGAVAVANNAPVAAVSVSQPVAARPVSNYHVRMVKVQDAPSRSRDIMIVRPQPADTVKLADASPATAPEIMVMQAGDSVRRVSLDKPAASALPANHSSSKFVFAN